MNDDELRRVARAMVRGLGALLIEHAELVAEYAVTAASAEASQPTVAGESPRPAPVAEIPAMPAVEDQRLIVLRYREASSPDQQEIMARATVKTKTDARLVFELAVDHVTARRLGRPAPFQLLVVWDHGKVAIGTAIPGFRPYAFEILPHVDPAPLA